MKQFIAFDDDLNITNKEPDDAFSYLAGGELYANTFAAGAGYMIGRTSQINYTSIFLPFFVDEISSMLELNEDFVEFALMPMQMIFYKSADEKRRGYEKFDEISEDTQKIVKLAKDLHERSGGKIGFTMDDEPISQRVNNENFLKELVEQRQKSAFKQLLQNIAYAKFGVVGAIVAGWVYDGRVSGAVVVDVVERVVSAKIADVAAGLLANAIGLQAGFATLGLGMVIGSILDEAFEVASGLDISFGFGGDIAGFNEIGQGIYEAPLSFWEGVKSMFGGVPTKDLAYDKESYERTGQIAGVKTKFGMYIGQVGDNLVSGKGMGLNKKERDSALGMAKSMARDLDKASKMSRSEKSRQRQAEKHGSSSRDGSSKMSRSEKSRQRQAEKHGNTGRNSSHDRNGAGRNSASGGAMA
ncbi:nuclear hormone receptor family protein [Campylobacter concisus]|uniref:nuclear hormone receptor family protein n=1 Tax=Campylobacter concisus TaxID=199 RepID=UPI000CD8FE80|nr:nuclear hormone receptor family protein [Campylobacter concisus]